MYIISTNRNFNQIFQIFLHSVFNKQAFTRKNFTRNLSFSIFANSLSISLLNWFFFFSNKLCFENCVQRRFKKNCYSYYKLLILQNFKLWSNYINFKRIYNDINNTYNFQNLYETVTFSNSWTVKSLFNSFNKQLF